MNPNQRFPEHVFDALGVPPHPFQERLSGEVMVVAKQPEDGPLTIMTAGASRLPVDSGEPVELAVEVLPGHEGAALAALEIVVDDMLQHRRVPPVGAPWRNSEPFLKGTQISALLVTPSRWGAAFDDVLEADGTPAGHVRTLRLLTDAEAEFASQRGWNELVAQAGGMDALLDVLRTSTVQPRTGVPNVPVFLSKLHAKHPPRWVTFTGADLRSVTGLESEEYMDDASNHEVISAQTFVNRFPFVTEFVSGARTGQTALFVDQSGRFVLEEE
jgi:hypothetical protein